MAQPTMLDLAPSLQEPGKRLLDAGELKLLFSSLFDVIMNVTATGTDQASALPVTGGFVWVTGGDGAGVSLSPGALGQQIRIFADVPGGITVYPPVPGSIMSDNQNSPGVASASIGGGLCGTFVCLGPGMWKQVS